MAKWWMNSGNKISTEKETAAELRICISSLEAQIAQLRQHREAPSASETRFRCLFEQNLDPVFTLDNTACITSANSAAAKCSGYSVEELKGMSILQLLLPESLPTGLLNFNRALLGETCTLDAVIRAKDGRRIELFITGGPITTGGVFGIAKDVTERNQTQRRLQQFNDELEQRVQQRSAERDRLELELLEITNRERQRIGHEIQEGICQQLTAITLLCKVLSEKAQKTAITAAEIQEIGRQTAVALDQARTLARELQPLEVNELVPALEELAAATERCHGVSCSVITKGDVELLDSISALQLYRIASDAVTNAIRHGSAQQLKISLVRNNGTIQLTIRDDGKWFDPQTATAGTDHGLPIMRHRAEIIRACFDIHREDERGGTVVTCAVPVPTVSIETT